MVQITSIPKQVLHTLWKQRVCFVCAANATIGIALMVIGALALSGCIASLALSQIGAIGLLAVGGSLLAMAAPWLLIKVIYGIKNKHSLSFDSDSLLPLTARTPRGDNPIRRFKELCNPKVAEDVKKFFNKQTLFKEMTFFEKNHEEYDYFIAEILESKGNQLIVGIVQASGDGNVSWHCFKQTDETLAYDALEKDASNNQYQSSKATSTNTEWSEDLLEMFATVINNIKEIQ